MRVVSDSSPFIALHSIGRLEVLPQLFRSVSVPRAVANEIKSVALPQWVTVVDVPPPAQTFSAGFGLGRGETEAIRLALHLNPDWLLMDDAPGRRAAQRLNLPSTGVLGILLAARRSNILATIRPELDRLIANGFHIGPGLRRQLLAAAEA